MERLIDAIDTLFKKILLLLLILITISMTVMILGLKNFAFHFEFFKESGSIITFAIVGFLSGVMISFYFKLCFRTPKHIRSFLIVLFSIFFIGSFAYLFFKVSLMCYMRVLPIKTFGYINHIKYHSQDKNWMMKEQLEIELFDLQDAKKTIQELTLSGWKVKKQQDNMVLLGRIRKQKVISRWLPFYTVNKIYLPEIKTMHKGIISRSYGTAWPHARFIIDAPKNLIGLVYPSHNSREDMLESNEERLEVLLSPLSIVPEEKYVLRIQVLSPLIRNKIGRSIITILFYQPLKWIALVLCAIFGEQIRKRVLVPFVKRTFKLFRISYLEDKKQ